MVKIKLIYLCIILICGQSMSQNPNKYNSGNVYVDVLVRRFLELESTLWKEIEQKAVREDKTVILKKIHTEFLKFYSRPFIAADTPIDYGNIFGQTFFKFEMFDADLSMSTIKNQYLQRELDRSLDHELIDMAHFYHNTSLLDRIHHISYEKDYFAFLKENGDAQNCSNQHWTTIESTSDVLTKQYEIVARAKLKMYTKNQLSLMFLTVYNNENKIAEANDLRKRYVEQSKLLQNRIQELISTAKRDIWMCDMPADFYDEKDNQITHLLDGYVDNEVNLNNGDDCTQTCSDYKVTKNYGCYKGTYCEKEEESFAKCKGTVVDCQFIESDLEICSAAPYKERRFESIIYASGRTLGNPNLCHQSKTKINSWTRVITGVALRKINRIFFWGITQSTLLNNGQLNQTRYYFNSWKRIKEFNITDAGITDGIDYHTLSWQNRSIYLDTLVAPPGYVLTGIRFNVVNGRLVLAIRVTRFDFKSGRLFDSFEWISNPSDNREPFELDRPYESSHKSKTKSIPYATENRYVQFQPTDIDKDGGQTTVPFIDVQLVEPPKNRPTLLSGAGIFYKGEPGYGGFIAPKVITYDYAPHIG